MRLLSKIGKYEPWLFCLVILVNLLPVLFTSTMFSLDGPAHSYNAALIKQFITGNGHAINAFLEVNTVPVPNWTGHLLMALFQFFVSPVFSEKLLVITLLVLTPFSFRYLVKSFPRYQVAGAYFIFALTYNAFQSLGFYNFLLALIPAFYLVGYMIRHLGKWKRRQYLVLSFLLVLVYFSHAFVYLLCLLIVALVVVFHVLTVRDKNGRERFMYLLRLSWPFILVVLPSAVLFYWFYQTKPELFPVYLGTSEIIQYLKQNRSLLCFTEEETFYTQPLLLVFIALALLAFVYRLKDFIRLRQLNITDIFPLLLGLMLVLLFVLPDGDGWGGYYTMRTLFLLNLFMLLWAAVVHLPSGFKILAVVALLVFHAGLLKIHYHQYKQHQPTLAACTRAGSNIETGALVLPVNLTSNWIYGHVISRAGAVNQAIVLENYEAGMNYFPLKWCARQMPRPVFRNSEVPREFVTWPVQNTGGTKAIDYIFVIGNLSEQTGEVYRQLEQVVQSDYKEIFNEENCHLFKLKQ